MAPDGQSYAYSDFVGGGVRWVKIADGSVTTMGASSNWNLIDVEAEGAYAQLSSGGGPPGAGLWLLAPREVSLETAELSDSRPVEHSARLLLRLDGIPFEVTVSWNAPLLATEIAFEIETDAGNLRWENVGGSFCHFRTLRNGEGIDL